MMNTDVKGSVTLPGSKSESNRALMIAAYGGFPLDAVGLSDAHDTVLLQKLLRQIAAADLSVRNVVDCEDAGTVTRFLLTYLACRDGEWLMTGSERMCQRPIGPLVDALQQLGAQINYHDKMGFLPLRIKGQAIEGGRAHIDASQSSQFVSSLLLAAPCWSKGLQLCLDVPAASKPYIGMSVAMMRHFGAEVQQEGSTIVVSPKCYQSIPYEISADWSAASYWYELAALSDSCELLLEGLREDALQGDRAAKALFARLGVSTRFDGEGAWLTKASWLPDGNHALSFDLIDTPDLFPALLVSCVALHLPAVFHGIRNLALKESNRVVSILSELQKIYTFINIIDDDFLVIDKSSCIYNNDHGCGLTLNTSLDHRIAMAFAPLMTRFSGLVLDHSEVVNKSYPSYWIEFHKFVRL